MICGARGWWCWCWSWWECVTLRERRDQERGCTRGESEEPHCSDQQSSASCGVGSVHSRTLLMKYWTLLSEEPHHWYCSAPYSAAASRWQHAESDDVETGVLSIGREHSVTWCDQSWHTTDRLGPTTLQNTLFSFSAPLLITTVLLWQTKLFWSSSPAFSKILSQSHASLSIVSSNHEKLKTIAGSSNW